MRALLSSIALTTLTLASSLCHAEVKVDDAWVRATVPQQKSTGAFMRITSTEPTTLVAVRTSAAPVSEVHEMKMEDNVMKMRKVEPGVAIQPGKPLELKPGGYHVMLMDLPAAMTAGAHVPLTLVFKDAAGKESTVDVHAMVRALNANAPAAMDHGKHKH